MWAISAVCTAFKTTSDSALLEEITTNDLEFYRSDSAGAERSTFACTGAWKVDEYLLPMEDEADLRGSMTRLSTPRGTQTPGPGPSVLADDEGWSGNKRIPERMYKQRRVQFTVSEILSFMRELEKNKRDIFVMDKCFYQMHLLYLMLEFQAKEEKYVGSWLRTPLFKGMHFALFITLRCSLLHGCRNGWLQNKSLN